MHDDWQIEQTSFAPGDNLAYEGLFTQGSGYLHVRGSLEEHLSNAPQNRTWLRMPGNVTAEAFSVQKAKWGTFVPGIFGKHPFFYNEMVNLPWFLDLRLQADNESLDLEKSTVRDYRRALNLKTGELTRSFVWRTSSGKELHLRFSRFVSGVRKQLCCQSLVVECSSRTELVLRGGIDADVRTSGHDHLVSTAFAPLSQSGLTCTVTTDVGDTVQLTSRFIAANTAWTLASGQRKAELWCRHVVGPGQTLRLEKRTAVATSRDLVKTPPPQVLDEAAGLSYDTLLQEHAVHWQARWLASDVVVDGDRESQLALRACIYHLLRCHVPDDPRVSIDAKGYAGDAYFGHFFWDTEMYLLPFYLYTDPARARTLVDFRVQSLDGARRNAKEYGYPGARFPWESDSDGNESCSKANWQYRDHEVHVTGDVAYGIAHYASAAGGQAYLEHAAAVLVETARYWCARVDWRKGDDYPSLLGVMGPDEYTPISHNNSYTNRLAALNLELAARVGRLGGASEEECDQFRRVASLLPQPRSQDGRLVLQCEGFDRFAEPQFDRYWKDRSRQFAANVSQERLYRSKCAKQADVLMLMLLFAREFTREEMKLAWDTYVPLCTHDSSLSAGAHALVAARLGLAEDAWRFWLDTCSLDLNIANGGAAQGIHIANAGATWMVAVYGFAGMSSAMESDTLTLNPKLPAHWNKLSFPIVWKGSPLSISLERGRASIHNRSAATISVCVCDVLKDVAPDATGLFQIPTCST